MKPLAPLALRLQAILLRGIVTLYNRKLVFLHGAARSARPSGLARPRTNATAHPITCRIPHRLTPHLVPLRLRFAEDASNCVARLQSQYAVVTEEAELNTLNKKKTAARCVPCTLYTHPPRPMTRMRVSAAARPAFRR